MAREFECEAFDLLKSPGVLTFDLARVDTQPNEGPCRKASSFCGVRMDGQDWGIRVRRLLDIPGFPSFNNLTWQGPTFSLCLALLCCLSFVLDLAACIDEYEFRFRLHAITTQTSSTCAKEER